MKLGKPLAVLALMMGSWTVPQVAHASTYGCQVLLCLANPGGPTQYSECVPPITRLWDDLDHLRPFPTCDQSDGNQPGNYAQQLYAPYDPCPSPLKPAAQGSYVVQGSRNSTKKQSWFYGGADQYTLVGQPQMSEPQSQGQPAGPQACVGNIVGTYTIGNYNDGDQQTITVYDQVQWQQYKSPRAIDVYVNGQWYNRVHY